MKNCSVSKQKLTSALLHIATTVWVPHSEPRGGRPEAQRRGAEKGGGARGRGDSPRRPAAVPLVAKLANVENG